MRLKILLALVAFFGAILCAQWLDLLPDRYYRERDALLLKLLVRQERVPPVAPTPPPNEPTLPPGSPAAALAANPIVIASTDEVLPEKPPEAEPFPPPATGSALAVSERNGYWWFHDWENSSTGPAKQFVRRWKPASGGVKTTEIPDGVFLPGSRFASSAVATGWGLMLLRDRIEDRTPVVVFTQTNRLLRTSLQVARENPVLLSLLDGSVLVVGGVAEYRDDKKAKPKTFANAVERVILAGDSLKVERLPDFPGEARRGVSFAELWDGRVMALGGSTSQYLGQEPMTADTWFLDVAGKTWQPGPKMIEPRTNASASVFPDGSVLVAGGWTPKHTWNDTPTRSTERWDPQSNHFSRSAELPIGVAGHQAMRLPGNKSEPLLIFGGMIRAWQGNQVVLALVDPDNADSGWRTVGENCVADDGHRDRDFIAAPFFYRKRAYIWCGERARDSKNRWTRVLLRLPGTGVNEATQVDPESGIALHRFGMAFLPPRGDQPGLALGGSLEGADSASVEAVWSDGRVRALAPLNHARRSAQVFRLRDGSFLAAGGAGGDSSRSTLHVPPLELLPAGTPLDRARWLDLEIDLNNLAGMGQFSDGSLLAVRTTGEAERLTVIASGARPVVQRHAFPPLGRRRMPSYGDGGMEGGLVIKELADGRIIAAGGNVQRHRIARLGENSLQPDAPDEFIGVGELAPPRHYDIYDPATKVWRESAPSRGEGDVAAILDDGRVVKWGVVPFADAWEAQPPGSWKQKATLEISSADGRSWQVLPAPAIAVDDPYNRTYPFVIQGELFLFGRHAVDVTPSERRDVATAQWFDASGNRWKTLWESTPKDNWYRDHIGRIIVRDLPNGKRVVLPISGPFGNAH